MNECISSFIPTRLERYFQRFFSLLGVVAKNEYNKKLIVSPNCKAVNSKVYPGSSLLRIGPKTKSFFFQNIITAGS